jgi:hypothetical protein
VIRFEFYSPSLNTSIPYGLTARIAGFHPAGPGLTPGMGIIFIKFNLQVIFLYYSRRRLIGSLWDRDKLIPITD